MSAQVEELVAQVAESNVQVQSWTERRDKLAQDLKSAAGWSDEELATFMADEARQE